MAKQVQAVVSLPRRITGVTKVQMPTTGYDRGQVIPKDNYVDTTLDLSLLRGYQETSYSIRALYETNGLLSSAVTSLVALSTTEFRLNAYTTGSNEYNTEGLKAAESVVALLSTLSDYSGGYSDQPGIYSLISTMLTELCLTGSVGMELVLDTSRYPRKMVVVPADTLVWLSDGKGGKYPAQRPKGSVKAGQSYVELNIPTFWVASVTGAADGVYTVPPLSAAIQSLSQYQQFIEDAWRVVRQAGMPRTAVQLSYEKVVAAAPAEVRSDAAKMTEYLDSVRTQVETQLRGLAPEDALVFYDVAEAKYLQASGEKGDISDLMMSLSGLAASALKASPTQLGLRLGGSQNTASTEALLFGKQAKQLQRAVEEIMSRALTLAVRLLGVDCYVLFSLNEPDLRPESELEAFRSLKQNRVMELLSLGRVTDDEAQSMLGLGSLPEGAEELSGTGFHNSKPMQTLPSGNDDPNGRGVAAREVPVSAGGRDNQPRR